MKVVKLSVFHGSFVVGAFLETGTSTKNSKVAV
jgi:hypothetical protein